MPNLDFFSTYMLQAAIREIVPARTFFRDRYFPTEDGDIFKADKVLVEYQKGDRRIAPFVSDRIGDIPVDRQGYTVREYQPARVAPSRRLTLDDLKKRGFGEALYPGMDQAQRAARLQIQDLSDLDRRIAGREEWMCVQTMLNNGCTIQEYMDDKTTGEEKHIMFYEGASDHSYTVANKWDGENADAYGDVKAMGRLLSTRGLTAADLVLGPQANDALMDDKTVAKLLDRNTGFNDSVIAEQLSAYDGVTFVGVLNFGGYRLNVICANHTYVDSNGTTQAYFPEKGAMVTAPRCGHLMYGQVTQIDYGSTEFTTHAASRVPKLVIDQENDVRKLRLVSRPLAAPRNYCPFIYAADVVS